MLHQKQDRSFGTGDQVWESDARAVKRRRLNVVNDRTTTTIFQLQAGFSLNQFEGFSAEFYGESSNGHASAGEEPACFASDSDVAARQSVDDGEDGKLCCFGMLSYIPVRSICELSPTSANLPVAFRSPDKLSLKVGHHSTVFEIPCQTTSRVIGELQSIGGIKTQLFCVSRLENPPRKNPQQRGIHRGKPSHSCFLNIIIYGTEGLEGMVGEYLSRRKMYLQDPVDCERNVPYLNPHIIPLESGETVMTNSFDSMPGDLEIERLELGPDLLAQLMEDTIPLPETEPPSIIKTALFRHQKQALTFMVKREKGWALEDSNKDIWSIRRRDKLVKASYINNVSGSSSSEPPPEFRGGLLADDMGLGKTLSMISLVTANQACDNLVAQYFPSFSSPMKTTLLIVPPALIQSWEKQFDLHLQKGVLKLHVYHGHNRIKAEFLGSYDVVITTYHTVSAIWRKRNENAINEKSIFQMTWHRVILDEAHIIQNAQSQLAQACCAIRSPRRWAITGTPIQNKLADFASIVKFLQVYPYSDRKTFEQEIVQPWQNCHGQNAQGFLRLRTLVRAITISRTKGVVSLPPRIDEIHHLNFTLAEREKYDAAKTQSRRLLEEAISSGNGKARTFNALWLLNKLRLICNHGLLEQSDIEDKATQRSQRSPLGYLQQTASSPNVDSPLESTAACFICGAELLDDLLQGSVSGGVDIGSQVAGDGRRTCERCSSQMSLDIPEQTSWSNQESLDINMTSGSATPLADQDIISSIEHMSTKIKALVADLSKHHTTEKSVVFSYWTHTLDLVQLMLNNCGISYTRIDGKTSLRRRTDALRAFQYDDHVRVILVSITCGGAGLDLTTGSRAYLLEPHWNPMVEEQALSRIHRVGQQREITTIRYLMRDSFEEQVVDIQKRKKMLAQVMFAEGSSLEAGINSGILQYLKTILG